MTVPSLARSIRNAVSLTYFKGPGDIIFYSRGRGTHPDDSHIRATAVFYPNRRNPDRQQYGNLTEYSQYILNGYLYELELIKSLPKEVQRTLKPLYTIDRLTNEPILSIPVDSITEIYNPQTALISWLEDPPIIPNVNEVQTKIKDGVNLLESNGIPRDDIGLYGALQCFIISKNKNKPINDIDFLIYSIDNTSKIVRLAAKFDNPIFSPYGKCPFIRGRMNRKTIRRKKSLGTIWRSYGKDELFYDVKIVRKRGDPTLFPNFKNIKIDPEAIIRGKVVDSSEALTSPSVYVVKTEKGLITVATRFYDFIAAAYKGDEVVAKGRTTADGKYLLITDPENHYIIA